MNEQEISNGSNTAGHKRRGPFLPRDDLANYNNDDDNDELSNNSQSNELKNNIQHTTNNNNSKPPQPPTTNNKRKKMKHIPVKSSGYGQSTTLQPPPSPANSINSTSSNHSKNSSSSSSRYRHTNNNKPPAAAVRRRTNNNNSRGIRSRSPSPSTTNLHQRQHNNNKHRSQSPSIGRKNLMLLHTTTTNTNGVKGIDNNGIKGTMRRSRTPSPLVKHPRHHNQNSSNKQKNKKVSALQKLKNESPARKRQHQQQLQGGREEMVGVVLSPTTSLLQQTSSLLNNNNSNNHFGSTNTGGMMNNNNTGSMINGEKKDYSNYSTLEVDPTPVKEAKRLSSIFNNKRIGAGLLEDIDETDTGLVENSTGSGLESSGVLNGGGLNSKFGSPLATEEKKSSPLSYSKVLRRGLTVDNGGAAGGSSSANDSSVAMQLFQPPSNTTDGQGTTNNSSSSNGTNQSSSKVDTTTSQIATLSNTLFSRSSGIDTTNIQRLLTKSRAQHPTGVGSVSSGGGGSSGALGGGEVKQWDLRKRLELKDEELGMLRTALSDLLVGKDTFVTGAIDIEKTLRYTLNETMNTKSSLVNQLRVQNVESEKMAEELEVMTRECDEHVTKYEVLTSELNCTKEEVKKLQQNATEHEVSLALVQSKLDESNTAKEEALEQLASMKSSKEEAIQEVESRIRSEMNEQLTKLQAENSILKKEMVLKAKETMDICTVMNVNRSDVNFTDVSATNSFCNVVKDRVEQLHVQLKDKEGVELKLKSCKVELEKVTADYQSALETVTKKDSDMSELLKSIGDIQRSNQDREQEVATQRKVAEDRATVAEGQVVQCREQIISLDHEKKTLEEALEASKTTCTTHESTITNLQKEIADSKVEHVQNDSQLQLERDLRSKAEEKEAEERAERVALAAQLNAQVQEHATSEKQLRESMESMQETLTEQIRLKEEEATSKDAEIAQCKETITGLEAHQLSLKQSLNEQTSMLSASKEEEIGRLKGEIANLESKLKSEVDKLQSAGIVSQAKVEELEDIIRKGQVERKRMHTIIQELRGNVRVFARIRPFLTDDGKQGEEGNTPHVSHDGDIVSVTKAGDSNQSHKFSFDRVFGPTGTQENVYEEVSEFVQSSLDGYNVCLFSYGQTGSGKTFTMQGAGTDQMRGLIPRSIEEIGAHKLHIEKEGWTFSMDVSFLEIYNEALRDLLRDNQKEESKHEIKVGSDGRRTVTNLTIIPTDPNDKEAVDTILALAAKRRSTAATGMNATSSRSHSVFTLHMTAKHEEQNKVVRGTLHLVDLAGSERLDRSGVTGQHAKEAMAINKSLSSLADVFTAIGQKQSHVPFRNSRLTYLLQPALSGDGKMCMFVNISPTEASLQESLCSLRFASKVNKCELGKAKRTIEEVKQPKRGINSMSSSNKGSGTSSRNVRRKV